MRLIITLLVVGLSINLIGQQSKMIIPNSTMNTKSIIQPSEIKTGEYIGTLNPTLLRQDEWNVDLQNTQSFTHTSSIPKDELKTLKKVADERRNSDNQHALSTISRIVVDSPNLGLNFRGNSRDNSVPLDNSMAVSRNGFIVSGINSNIAFVNASGTITYQQPLPTFFALLDLGTRMYDPRIIYDVEQNRFIAMCLNGSDAETTHLCIAFSKTEDPNGEWHYYKIDGNPDGDDNWFDYPNVAVSKNDLYISGLMRNLAGDWQYTVLYQIDKMDGFNGKALTWRHYNTLKDADGKPSFNLVPTPSGWNNLIGPGMYFVSNVAQGGNTYNLYYTDNDVNNNPVLIALQTTGLLTALAPNGKQKNTDQVLNTFDSRIWSAMYLNGIIHFGGHVMSDFGTSGLLYGRFEIANLKVDATIYAKPDIDYGFPSFTSFGNAETESKILINHLVSGTNMYPSQEALVCEGTGSDFRWSDPVFLKEGIDHIDALGDIFERWGDYTTSCRRFNGDRIESWVTGCFGEQRRYGTWLGQFVSPDQASMLFADFSADKSTTQKNVNITFKDATLGDITAWSWSMPGAIPSSSTVKNPQVKYAENGVYDVTLEVTNSAGVKSTHTKQEFIHIQNAVVAPIANFIVLSDTIFTNDTAYYIDASLNDPVSFSWTFTNGTPNKSSDKNPKVVYKNSGQFGTILIAKNIAGSNTKIISKVITVLKRSQPEALFTSDKTEIEAGESVSFQDKSKNGPSNWLWTFPGGVPSTSTDKNPSVSYPNIGSYDVSLTVSNDAGNATITLPDYISVGSVATNDKYKIVNEVLLYPNPVTGDRLTMNFYLNETKYLYFSIIDAQGRLIKSLIHDKVKQGSNEISFNVSHLPAASYSIVVSDKSKQRDVIRFTVVK